MADEVEPDASDDEPDTGGDVDELRSLIDGLGLTPGQVKGRLEASRKWEERAKKAQAAEKKLAELEEAGKSEAQKLADQLAESQKRAEQAEQRALRMEVAQAKGLTAAQAKRLVGSTAEELEADADELLASFTVDEPDPSGRPKPRLKGGTDPEQEPSPDMREVVESVTRGF